MNETIHVERSGPGNRVATIVLDAPPVNVLDLATIAALDRWLETLAGDRELQLVIVRGATERAFSAGVSVADHTPDKVATMLRTFHSAILRLRDLAAPTLAVVQGHCLGGGLELAAACDMLLAGEGARFGQPEIKLACFPPVAAALYPQRLRGGATYDLLLSGRTVGTAEAERMGLVTWRVPDAEIASRLAAIVDGLTAASAPVSRLTKRAIRLGETMPPEEALAAAEKLYLEELAALADMNEGIASFVEKRPPVWKHR